jgi:hypothetical protein
MSWTIADKPWPEQPLTDSSSDTEINHEIPAMEGAEGTDESEQRRKRSRTEQVISDEEWKALVVLATNCMKNNIPKEINRAHFSVEQEQRYSIRNPGLGYLMVFPWFNYKNFRFRQTLKKDERQGPTIEQVIEAANYFLTRGWSDYKEEELEFLRDYYSTMKIPIASHCFTTIVEVYNDFRRYQATPQRK